MRLGDESSPADAPRLDWPAALVASLAPPAILFGTLKAFRLDADFVLSFSNLGSWRVLLAAFVLAALVQGGLALRSSATNRRSHAWLLVGATLVAMLGSLAFVASVHATESNVGGADSESRRFHALVGTADALSARVLGDVAAGALLGGVALALVLRALRGSQAGDRSRAATTWMCSGGAFLFASMMFAAAYVAVLQRAALEAGSIRSIDLRATVLARRLPALERGLDVRLGFELAAMAAVVIAVTYRYRRRGPGPRGATAVMFTLLAATPVAVSHGALAYSSSEIRALTETPSIAAVSPDAAQLSRNDGFWTCTQSGFVVPGVLVFADGARLPSEVSRAARALSRAATLPHARWRLPPEAQRAADRGEDPFVLLRPTRRWTTTLELFVDPESTRRDLRVALQAAAALDADVVVLVGEVHGPRLDRVLQRYGDLELAFPLTARRAEMVFIRLSPLIAEDELRATRAGIAVDGERVVRTSTGGSARRRDEPTRLEFTDVGDLVSLVVILSEQRDSHEWLYDSAK